MGRLKVRDVMSQKVVTVEADVTVRDAAQLMHRRDVSGLPVIDQDARLVGIITESDLLAKEATPESPRRISDRLKRRRNGQGKAHAWLVSEAMTTEVVVAGPDDELRSAARRLAQKGVKRLPVVTDGRVVGVISRHDVIGVFNRDDHGLRQAVARFLEECGYGKPFADVEVRVGDGIVMLNGTVDYPSDIKIAGRLAGSVDGVIDVINRLGSRQPEPTMRNVDLARGSQAL